MSPKQASQSFLECQSAITTWNLFASLLQMLVLSPQFPVANGCTRKRLEKLGTGYQHFKRRPGVLSHLRRPANLSLFAAPPCNHSCTSTCEWHSISDSVILVPPITTTMEKWTSCSPSLLQRARLERGLQDEAGWMLILRCLTSYIASTGCSIPTMGWSPTSPIIPHATRAHRHCHKNKHSEISIHVKFKANTNKISGPKFVT